MVMGIAACASNVDSNNHGYYKGFFYNYQGPCELEAALNNSETTKQEGSEDAGVRD